MANRRYEDTSIVNIDYKKHGANELHGVRKFDHYIYPYPNHGNNDIYIITIIGDRLDALANEYYGDPSLWWYIASSNGILASSFALEPNIRLRIPPKLRDSSQTIRTFNRNR